MVSFEFVFHVSVYRVVILVLSMLIVIPILTVSDTDSTQSMATIMIHHAALGMYMYPTSQNYTVCCCYLVRDDIVFVILSVILWRCNVFLTCVKAPGIQKILLFRCTFRRPSQSPPTMQSTRPTASLFNLTQPMEVTGIIFMTLTQ